MKRVIIFLLCSMMSIMCIAQGRGPANPPTPPDGPENKHPHNPFGPEPHQGPVGTATALMVCMGAGYGTYKLKKNKKEE